MCKFNYLAGHSNDEVLKKRKEKEKDPEGHWIETPKACSIYTHPQLTTPRQRKD